MLRSPWTGHGWPAHLMNNQTLECHDASRMGPLILMVAYDFFPSNQIGARRVTALARFLVTRGYRVAIISSFGDHDIETGSEIIPGIIAFPVKRPPKIVVDALITLKKNIAGRFGTKNAPTLRTDSSKGVATAVTQGGLKELFFRALCFVDEFKKWSWRASRAATEAAEEHAAKLIISSGPPNSALLAGTLAARRLRIPHIADLRDPWTDAVTANPRYRFDYFLQRPLEKWMVRSASRITSAGAAVAERLAARYPDAAGKIYVVRNGFDGRSDAVQTTTGGKLSILFAGELYLGRNPYPFLDALESLLRRDDVDAEKIRVTFMGRVDQYDGHPISEWLSGKRLSRIMTILPHGPAEDVNRAVSEATVLLNLAQQQPYSVPAKTYEHLIANREILVICESDSETARVVKGIHGVIQVDSGNSVDLEQALLDLYHRHAVQGILTTPSAEEVHGFSRSAANEEFLSIINGVLDPDVSATH